MQDPFALHLTTSAGEGAAERDEDEGGGGRAEGGATAVAVARDPAIELGEAILALGRAAVARLTERDAAGGFVSLAPTQRAALQAQAARFEALAAAALGLARARPEVARLCALVPTVDEAVLGMLAAAPELDRALARAYAAVLAPEPALTAGGLLDLAAISSGARLALAATLHADRPLRAVGWLVADEPGPITLRAPVRVAPSVIGVLRGEPVGPPGPARITRAVLAAELAAVVTGATLAPRWRAGDVALITGAPALRAALVTLRSALDDRPIWWIDAGALHDPIAWCRDAVLARAHLVIDARDDEQAGLLARLAGPTARTGATVAVLSDETTLPAAVLTGLTVHAAATFTNRRDERMAALVPAGEVRQALEELGF